MRYLGIDIGGTQLRAAVFDATMHMLMCRKIPNDPRLGAEENLRCLLNGLEESGEGFAGVGIGSPGPVDIPAGVILNPPNLTGWDNFAVAAHVSGKLGVPARLNNDANLAGWAEALLGAGQGLPSVFYITASTGIGGAFVLEGKVLNGAHSAGGEIYNLIVNEDSYCHRGVNPGAANEQCGGHALERIASAAYGRAITPHELFDMCEAGDARAETIIARCADNMGKLIGNIICVVDPHAFVLGGSLALHNPWYVEKVRAAARRYAIHPDALDIRLAMLGDDAGLYGAGLLARECAQATPSRQDDLKV